MSFRYNPISTACFGISLLFFCVEACASEVGESELPVTGQEEAVLPESQLQSAMVAGALGDADAARKVYFHYGMGLAKTKEAVIWLEISAINGSAQSAKELSSYFLDEIRLEYRCRSLYWARIAKERGADGADKLLRHAEAACPLGK